MKVFPFASTSATTLLIGVLGPHLLKDFPSVQATGIPPPNDLCVDAEEVVLESIPVTIVGTTIDATSGSNTGCRGPNHPNTAPGVWYKFEANFPTGEEEEQHDTGKGIKIVATTNCDHTPDPQFITQINVYVGGDDNCDDLTCYAVHWEDIGQCSGLTGLEFSVVPGQTYFLYIQGREGDDFDLTLSCHAEIIPTNNYCDDALQVVLGPTPIVGTTIGATLDNGVVVDSCDSTTATSSSTTANDFGPAVWYTFVADCPEELVELKLLASTCSNMDTNYHAKISIYTGGSCNGLTCVTTEEVSEFCHSTYTLEFDAVPGQTYFVQVRGFWNDARDFYGIEDFDLVLTCPTSKRAATKTKKDPNSSGMMGDPHIKNWKGEYFDWMGECDLNLFHVSNFDESRHDLTVHVRTTIRYDYSYIETAALRIGNDTLEVSAWGDYSFNGVEGGLINNLHHDGSATTTTAVAQIGGYPIFHNQISEIKHEFDIVLGHHHHQNNITITSMKDIVSVEVRQPTSHYFGNVEGLLGNFHGEMLARDGKTNLHDDINAMANEWQVRPSDDEPMLFRYAREPQYPAQCRLPNIVEKEARRLGEGIDVKTAEVACAHLLKKVDPQLFAACVYDVTATNDIEQASAY